MEAVDRYPNFFKRFALVVRENGGNIPLNVVNIIPAKRTQNYLYTCIFVARER